MKKFNIEMLSSIFLKLIFVHSFIIGILLISLPSNTMVLFGFQPDCERFFRMQGGVFHIIISVFYLITSFDVKKHRYNLIFIIFIKISAFLFLIIYYAFILSGVTVLLSGLADLTMGLLLFGLIRKINYIWGSRWIRQLY